MTEPQVGQGCPVQLTILLLEVQPKLEPFPAS